MNSILARVREVLEETGETQRALEKRGVATQQLLSRWATVDDAEPSSSSLAKIALKLGISGHWLLTGQGDKRLLPSDGADTVFMAGVLAGLQRAEAVVRELRATSSGESDPDRRERAERAIQGQEVALTGKSRRAQQQRSGQRTTGQG